MNIAADIDEGTLRSLAGRSLLSMTSDNIVPKEQTQKLSKNVTTLHNSFNQIYAYTANIMNIHKHETRRLDSIKRETAMESMETAGSMMGSAELAVGNLPGLFEILAKNVDTLTKKLDQLDLSKRSKGTPGIVGAPGGGPTGARTPGIPKIRTVGKVAAIGAAVAGAGALAYAATRPEPEGSGPSLSSRFADSLNSTLKNVWSWMGFGRDSGGEGPGATAPTNTTSYTADQNAILATIREMESSNNYKAKNPSSTASGAYQFIDKTWQSLSKKYGVGTQYPKAMLAPPEIQDQVAGRYVNEILARAKGDVTKVPLEWFTGNVRGQSTAVTPDKVTAYQQKWLKIYSSKPGVVPTFEGQKVDTSKPGITSTSSNYGQRYDPFSGKLSQHKGKDIKAPAGSPVAAGMDGVVNKAESLRGYGNVIYIDHANGIQTRYAHLSSFASGISPGTRVSAGDVIGAVGSTGKSTGPHLHFEVRKDGEAIDPEPFYKDRSFIVGGQMKTADKITPAPAAAPAPVAPRVGMESLRYKMGKIGRGVQKLGTSIANMGSGNNNTGTDTFNAVQQR